MGSVAPSPTGPVTAQEVAHYLRDHAQRYGGDVEGRVIDARVVQTQLRPASHLYWSEVLTDRATVRLLVKVPVKPNAPGTTGRGAAVEDRPRVVDFAPAEEKSMLEYDALSRIHDHFSGLSDDRFGTVPVYDYVEDWGALVMKAVRYPSLKEVMVKRGRWPLAGSARDLRYMAANAGAWLRTYHGMTHPKQAPNLMPSRADYVHFNEQLAAYLARHGGRRQFFDGLLAELAAEAAEVLPERLRAGLTHGDFAARNVLVGPADRVTVIDTTARYLAPIYRDIGAFLANLSYGSIPVMARGAWMHPFRLGGLRQSFLQGYFGDSPVPTREVRLFEAQSLLEQWCSSAWSMLLQRTKQDRATDRARWEFISVLFSRLLGITVTRDGRRRRAAGEAS